MYPAGSIGNSEELVRSDETWFSTTPGLSGILVRQINDDAQMGKITREMVKACEMNEVKTSFARLCLRFPLKLLEMM